MIENFNNFPWHDTELKKIIIDRESKDIVRIQIRWPEENENNYSYIEFFDCYALKADMHFGIVPPDYILEAECISQSQELDDIKKLWEKMGLNLSALYCFRIITNSTNSIISIFALGYRIISIES